MYFCLAIPLLQEVKSWLLLTALGQLSALIKVISVLPFSQKSSSCFDEQKNNLYIFRD